MKLLGYVSSILILVSVVSCHQPGGDSGLKEEPIITIRKVADKIVKGAQFQYQLGLNPLGNRFDQIESLDFGKIFGLSHPAVAYALTSLVCDNACTMNLGISHSDGLMIWLNDSLIYDHRGNRKAILTSLDEETKLAETLKLNLKIGANRLLLKSETEGNDWKVFFKADSSMVDGIPVPAPFIGLKGIPGIAEDIQALSHWLVIGPFPNPFAAGQRKGLNTMAIARGINQGWLDRESYQLFAIKGWKALCSEIEPNGTMHNICIGAVCSPDLQYYLNLPLIDNDLHGIPGLIFASVEMQQLLYPKNK